MSTNRDQDRLFFVVNIVLIVLGLAYVLLQFGVADAVTRDDDSAIPAITDSLLAIWLVTIFLWLVMLGRRSRQLLAHRRIRSISRRKRHQSIPTRHPAHDDVWSTIQETTRQQFTPIDGEPMTLQEPTDLIQQNSMHAQREANSRLTADSALAPVAKPTEWTLQLLQCLEWRRFEQVCMDFFGSISLRATSVLNGPEAAVSLRLLQPDSKTTYGLAKTVAGIAVVDIEQIRALYAVMTHQHILRGFCLTAGTFTAQARTAARGVGLVVIDGATLFEKIVMLPPARQQALLALALEGDYMTPSCPICREKMELREADFNAFWRCSDYPTCKEQLRPTPKATSVI